MMTPSTVHYGLAQSCNEARQDVLSAAHATHPERFVRGLPKTIALPQAAWINKPDRVDELCRLSAALAVDCDPELSIERKAR